MKAKSLHFSKRGTVQPIAAEIGRVFQCVCDQIPPAYPCEGEKVVFIGVDMSGKVPAPAMPPIRRSETRSRHLHHFSAWKTSC